MGINILSSHVSSSLEQLPAECQVNSSIRTSRPFLSLISFMWATIALAIPLVSIQMALWLSGWIDGQTLRAGLYSVGPGSGYL